MQTIAIAHTIVRVAETNLDQAVDILLTLLATNPSEGFLCAENVRILQDNNEFYSNN